MTTWEWGLYAGAIFVAVTTLVRLMAAHAAKVRRRLDVERTPPA